MTLYLGKNKISGESSRNIGEIVQSTIPLVDAGLHLLDGALINGSGAYGEFVDYIAGLVTDYPGLFTTEASWQTAVTTYGVCGKFVYDSLNNTLRLPKYSNKFWSGGGIANAKGNGMTLGMTDGTRLYGLQRDYTGTTLSFNQVHTSSYGTNVGTARTGSTDSYTSTLGITTDETKSGIIADLSTITTALDGYWYIVIANSTQTQVEIDINQVATDLNGKADTDLSNTNPSSSFKEASVGWGMPDYSAGISLSYNSFVSDWIAPSDGVICGKANWDSSTKYLTINGSIVQGGNTECYGIFFFVSKGDVIHNDSGVIESSHTYLTFYPLKGV